MIRLAVVGCSGIAPSYAVCVPRLLGMEFAVVVDPDLRLARSTATALNASRTACTVEALLADHADAFDAAIVDSAAAAREQDALLAAQFGKHLLVETPLASSTESADRIIAACRAADVRLMVGQAGRFLPSIAAVKSSLADGHLGEPGLLRIHDWQPQSIHPSDDASDTLFLSQVASNLDLAIWLFGSAPSEVFAKRQTRLQPDGDRLEFSILHLGFAGGGMAIIDSGRMLPPGDGYFSLSMIGSTGAAYADDHPNRQLLFRGARPAALKTGEGSRHLLAQLQEFANAIGESREPAITGIEGRTVVEIAAAAMQSIANNRAIAVKSE